MYPNIEITVLIDNAILKPPAAMSGIGLTNVMNNAGA